jgi:hypothetical protein
MHHRAAPRLIKYVYISYCCAIGYLYCYIIRKCNLKQALLQGFNTHDVTIGCRSMTRPEPVSVNLLRSPRMDSQPGDWNRFLGSLNFLQIRALVVSVKTYILAFHTQDTSLFDTNAYQLFMFKLAICHCHSANGFINKILRSFNQGLNTNKHS